MNQNSFLKIIIVILLSGIGYKLWQENQNQNMSSDNSGNITTASSTNSEAIAKNISNNSQADIQYSCKLDNIPVVSINNTPSGAIPFLIFKSNDFDKSGWTSDKRCAHIATKLQQFQEQGILGNIKAGKANIDDKFYPVICATKKAEDNCTQDDTLITLLPSKNANDVLAALTTPQDGAVINVSSSRPYDRNGYSVINMEAFIENRK